MSSKKLKSILQQASDISHEEQAQLVDRLKEQLENQQSKGTDSSSGLGFIEEFQDVSEQRVFTIKDDLFGTLVCSFEEDLLTKLDRFFADVLATEEEEDRCVVDLNLALLCREEALNFLSKGLQDVIEVLIREARLQVLLERNGWYFFLDEFNATEETNKIRDLYVGKLNKRIGARQGPQLDRTRFLVRLHKAYAAARIEANNKANKIGKKYVNENGLLNKSIRKKMCARSAIRSASFTIYDRCWIFYGRVTKQAITAQMQESNCQITPSGLGQLMKTYRVEISDLDKFYDEQEKQKLRQQ